MANNKTDSKTPASFKEKSILTQYMVAEFEMLHQRAHLQEQMAANKINFYLIAVTGLFGGIVLLSNNDAIKPLIIAIACMMSSIGLSLGKSSNCIISPVR